MQIKDASDYWAVCDKWWDQIIEMAADQLDLNSPAFDIPGKSESPMTGRTILEEMNFLKRERSTKLPRYFNAIFHLASEAYAYSKPGWSQLCDLCSEDWAIQPEEDHS